MTINIQIDDDVREATALEIKDIKSRQAEGQAEQTEAKAKQLVKSAAQAKLAALGLTVEDLTALGL